MGERVLKDSPPLPPPPQKKNKNHHTLRVSIACSSGTFMSGNMKIWVKLETTSENHYEGIEFLNILMYLTDRC